jgi:glycosyltransferase involved in cell wall biosynthesis
MRILLIITDYGSFNNFLSELAVKLVGNNYEVHVICSPAKVINTVDKHPYTELGIKFHYVSFPRSFNMFKQLAASRKIHNIINAINPYLINIHFTTGIFTTLLWRKPAQFTVGTIHGVGYPMVNGIAKRTVFEMVEKFCFNRLDQIYLLNDFDFELVKQLYPEKAFRYKSYGVGNDLERFDPFNVDAKTKATTRSQLCIKDNDFVLVFTGRFTAFKGFNKLIKAFNSLVNHYRLPDIKLLIIGGEDPIHSSGLNLQELVEYKNNEHIIKIDFTADVNLYLAIADVFVFPSEKEGMPVCIMEALSMGVPVITSDSRGCHDLIRHDFNGLLLSDNPTVSEIREAVLKLYRNRALVKKMSVNALSNRSDFSRQAYVDDQIAAYDQVSQNNNLKLA